MRIFTSQKNQKANSVPDCRLLSWRTNCGRSSSVRFLLFYFFSFDPYKTNRWFNIRFDWLCFTTYLEIRCCKNPKISLLTTTSETFSFATSTFSLTVSLTSENETKVYMNTWMDGYMLFFSVTANWQQITTAAGFFFYI